MYPKVTVITPVYNCERFIEQSINSVLQQDYPNLEYIIINDCSTDGTWNILAKYESKVIIIDNDQNCGEQYSVNQGLQRCTGDYFIILNADDLLLANAIDIMVSKYSYLPESTLCLYPNWMSINEDGSERVKVSVRDYDFNYMVRHHTCFPSVGSMFRSTVIQKVGLRDESFRWLGDFDYWLRVGLAGSMQKINLTLAAWRCRDGQASQSKSHLRAAEHIRIIQKFYNQCDPVQELVKVKNEAKCWSYIVAASVTDQPKESMQFLMKALWHYPGLVVDLEFYDTLIKRVKYILRR